MADHREPPRRQVDPLLAAAADAAAAGLRGADYVVEGLSETLRRRAGRPPAAARRPPRVRDSRARSRRYGPPPPGPEGPVPRPTPGGTAGLFAELLELFGETAQDFAAAIAEREWFDGGPRYPTLELQGAPGHTAREEFHFTNTGPSALTKVTFVATDLLGAADRIDAGEVTFKHGKDPHIPRVGPGQSARVAVAVAIPDAALTGTYRGVIAARSAAPTARAEAEGGPEDAWSLLELEVTAVDRRSAIAPAETVEA